MAASKMAVWNLFALLVSLLLNVYIIEYVRRLERTACECAVDWRRRYAVVYLAILIAYEVVITLLSFTRPALAASLIAALSPFLLVALVLYLVFSWQYVERLRREKCACSAELARDVWRLVLVIQIALLAFAAAMMVLVLVGGMMLGSTASASGSGGKRRGR